MELLGDEAQVDARFIPFGDSANLRKIGAWLVPNIRWAQKSFWIHLMVLLGDEAQVEPRFGPFGDSANLETK
jgi:hypothetical protein